MPDSKSNEPGLDGDERTPKLEESESPEQLRIKQNQSNEFKTADFQAEHPEDDKAKVQIFDQAGVVKMLPSQNKETEFIFEPMSDEETGKDGKHADDVDFSHLQRLSLVEFDEQNTSPTF